MSKLKKYTEGYYTKEEPIQCTQKGYEHRWICSGCLEEGHIQMSCDEALDCKMVFIKDNKTHGQCCCYSKEHGLRERRIY